MLAQFQWEPANLLSLSGAFMVALQHAGAAAVNMIAIHNVFASAAAVGLLGLEGVMLRLLLLPTVYYVVLAGMLGMQALHGIGIADPLSDAGSVPATRK